MRACPLLFLTLGGCSLTLDFGALTSQSGDDATTTSDTFGSTDSGTSADIFDAMVDSAPDADASPAGFACRSNTDCCNGTCNTSTGACSLLTASTALANPVPGPLWAANPNIFWVTNPVGSGFSLNAYDIQSENTAVVDDGQLKGTLVGFTVSISDGPVYSSDKGYFNRNVSNLTLDAPLTTPSSALGACAAIAVTPMNAPPSPFYWLLGSCAGNAAGLTQVEVNGTTLTPLTLDTKHTYRQLARADAGSIYFIADDGFGYFPAPESTAASFTNDRTLLDSTPSARALQIEPNSGIVSFYDAQSAAVYSQLGTSAPTTIVGIANVIAVNGDPTYVYWLAGPAGGRGALYRAARANTSKIDVIASQVMAPIGLATLNSCIYWLTGDGELHQFTTNYP